MSNYHMLLINYFELVVRGGVVLSRRRRGIRSVRCRAPERVVLGLLNGSERAERRPPHVRETNIRVAAPELRRALISPEFKI